LEALDRLLSDDPTLPDGAELETGSFLHLVKEAWKSVGRDGRSGHLSDASISEEIKRHIGRKFSRNMFQSMFGDSGAHRKRRGIPYDVAQAYLEIAFANWRHTEADGLSRFEPIIPSEEARALAIANACSEMFPTFEEHDLVYCIPSPGLGCRGFYKEEGMRGRSVLVSSARTPVLMTDASTEILAWQELMRTLLCTPAAESAGSIHVWALREPTISTDPNDVAALCGIADLRKVFLVTQAMARAKIATDDFDRHFLLGGASKTSLPRRPTQSLALDISKNGTE